MEVYRRKGKKTSGNKSGKDVVTYEDLQELLKIKIGDLYTTTVNEDPSSRLGYGTWERFAEGRTLVGFSGSVSNSIPEWAKTQGSEFGEYAHKLTVEELPTFRVETQISRAGSHPTDSDWTWLSNASGHANDGTTDSAGLMKSKPTGGDQPHNNVQPSKVVFIWIRTS